MDVATQLSKLQTRAGEPTDPNQARFSQAQLLDFLNEARHIVARETRCFAVKDSQAVPATISGQTAIVSVGNDFIGFYELEYDGRPMRGVQATDWRDIVGNDDTIQGDPVVVLYFARQFQLFPCPPSPGGKTLLYRGWAYPGDLVIGGADADLTDYISDTVIWQATMLAKGADERNTDYAEKMAQTGIAALKKQYMPRAPRYVKTGDLYLPWRPML